MPRINHISPFSFRPLILAGALLLLCLSSCSRVQSIREARTIVTEADSLRSAGQSLSPSAFHLSTTKSDSTTIASAVSALEPLRLIYPTAYAHANYYYGRLLREAGYQPEAMLAFLRVVHSRTKDHAIKGRSYCNIGIMSGLATEHELAYDMYERSAEEFLKAQDSIAYYYALIDMAFELAEQKRKDEAVSITNQIEAECRDYYVLTKIWETRADAYIQAQMYDSTIYCVRQLQARGNHEPTGILLKAKAYSFLGVKDSAVIYAEQAVQCTNSLFDLNNAYYILANEDATKDKEEALQCTRDRADIQKLIEIRQGQLSQATQLLEQDLNRKPNLTWLWATLATLCIIATSISIYVRKKKAKHQLISQQVEALQQTRDSLSAQTQQIENEQKLRQEKMLAEIELFCSAITENNINEELCWKDFDKMCAIINQRMYGLVDKLKSRGVIAESEVRLCVLVAIGKFDNHTMASLVPYGYDSFKTVKSSIATRLGLSGRKMRDSMLKLALGE